MVIIKLFSLLNVSHCMNKLEFIIHSTILGIRILDIRKWNIQLYSMDIMDASYWELLK